QRGYFEVIGVESLSCAPRSGVVDPAGGLWAKPNHLLRSEPTNALTSKVFLVRAAAGVSYSYNAPTIARFVTLGGGPIPIGGGLLANLDAPTLADCITLDARLSWLSKAECVSAVNLALGSRQLSGQFDIDSTTAGQVRIVATLPTKGLGCEEGAPFGTGPFTCAPEGEEITCTLSDRLGNFTNAPLTPPAGGGGAPEPVCLLPRVASELAVRNNLSDPAADFSLWSWELPDPSSGSIALNLADDALGDLIHAETYPEGVLNVFARDVIGYEGLPVVGLVIQEFANGNVGGAYGNTTPVNAFQAVVAPD
ncbi:MAG: hypothetical protein ABGY42_08280, partial [bacterium]